MTWKETHRVSAELASEARIKLSTGNSVAAVELFRAAATSELAALACVDASKPKTYGATAVSAASLLYKAHDLDGAERIACQYIGKGDLPAFAVEQLRDVLNLVWTKRSVIASGLEKGRDILFRFSGPRIVRGGAPFDAIVDRCKHAVSMLYRSAELVIGIAYKKRSSPFVELLDAFEPVIHMEPASSVQCAIGFRAADPQTSFLMNGMPLSLGREATRFMFQCLVAAHESPEDKFHQLIPNDDYRRNFLQHLKVLAPDGKKVAEIQCRLLETDDFPPVVLTPSTKQATSETMKRQFPRPVTSKDAVDTSVEGRLRSISLDGDWIEVHTRDHGIVKIVGLAEEADDVIGLMLNRKVRVSASLVGNRHSYVNIEQVE